MIPIGGIIQWSGAIVDIPVNFALCDGNNGTPDLTDKFIIGAGGAEAPGDTGGNVSHSHLSGGNSITSPAGSVTVWTDVPSSVEGNLPPYYALANIMRIA